MQCSITMYDYRFLSEPAYEVPSGDRGMHEKEGVDIYTVC